MITRLQGTKEQSLTKCNIITEKAHEGQYSIVTEHAERTIRIECLHV